MNANEPNMKKINEIIKGQLVWEKFDMEIVATLMLEIFDY